MKKIIATVLLVGLCFGCKKAHAAEPIQTTIAGLNFVLPMQQVDLVQCLDLHSRQGFTGVVTTLVTRKDYQLVAGAATGYTGHDNFPMVAFQTHLDNKFANIPSVKFGVFAALDSSQAKNHVRWGLMASLKLWE